MSTIQVSGLGSGLDYDSWIEELVAIKQAEIDTLSSKVTSINSQVDALSSLETNYSDLLTAIQKITDANLNSTDNVFTQKKASSSSEAISASVTAAANAQTVRVSVSNLATSTVAKSASVAASTIDSSTLVSEIAGGSITEGNFSIYVNGTKHSIAVDSDATLGTLLSSIQTETGLNASITDGKISIGAGSTDTITIGSNADTSNFAKVTALVKNTDGYYQSNRTIFDTDTTEAITSASFAAGTITAGKFKIGNDEFEVTASKSLNDIIKEINNSKDAGVSAYWDANAGKLVLESTDGGAVNINVEAGTSNFTDIMKLTSSGALATGSQTLGTNALLTINGTEITSASNTITSDISGISGLTLTLNDTTSSTAKISITNDTTTTVDAIKSFVDAYNNVISNTKTATSSTGYLKGESVLTMLATTLRSSATSANSDTATYKMLANIGITTGAFSTDTSTDTSQLVVDTEKLTKALQENPDAVMKLLLGDTTAGTTGVLTKVKTTVDSALDAEKGFFTTRKESFESQIDRVEEKIDRKTLALEKYQKQLETKFAIMDEFISKMQSQADQIDSLISSLTSSKENK